MNNAQDDLICPNCKVSKLQHYARNPDGTLKRDERGGPIYIRCQESRDYRAGRYYDDVLRRTAESGPLTTPLSELIVKDKYIKDALVVGDHRVAFNTHLKTFIYDLIETRKQGRFSFLRITIPDIRTCKFGEGERSFAKWDEHYLLIFNLDVEGYDNKADTDHLKELVDYRGDNFLPIWFLTSNAAIKNRHIPAEVRAHIQKLPVINLDSGQVTTIAQAADTKKKKSAADYMKAELEKAKAKENLGDAALAKAKKRQKAVAAEQPQPVQGELALTSAERFGGAPEFSTLTRKNKVN